jgi:radical SAM protein with 4Fe4S-binding SPASM domain
MSIRRAIQMTLDQFEEGRITSRRLALADRAYRPNGWQPHPDLAGLTHIYVEASFLCNLECQMCPRLLEGHREGLMPIERFQRLIPLFPYLDAVTLTGYGEPLLHPRLPEYCEIISANGSNPRLSTNGTILSVEKGEALLDAGVDNLQVSIDAGTKDTYEMIRVGGKWERVLRNVTAFHELRNRKGLRNKVGTGWVFVAMRSNWREIPLAAQEAARAGFDLFVVKLIERNALDFEQTNNLHDDHGNLLIDQAEWDDTIARTEAIAAEHGLEFRQHPFHVQELGACLVDPLRSMFIDWMGNISPCCHLPVRNDGNIIDSHSYGNVDETPILEILLGNKCQSFFQKWRNKIVPSVCTSCYQVTRIPNNHEYKREEETLPGRSLPTSLTK